MASIHFPMAALSTAAESTASDSSSARKKGNFEHILWGKQSGRQIILHLNVPVLPAEGEETLSHRNTQMRPRISASVPQNTSHCSFLITPEPQYGIPWENEGCWYIQFDLKCQLNPLCLLPAAAPSLISSPSFVAAQVLSGALSGYWSKGKIMWHRGNKNSVSAPCSPVCSRWVWWSLWVPSSSEYSELQFCRDWGNHKDVKRQKTSEGWGATESEMKTNGPSLKGHLTSLLCFRGL